MIKKRAFTLAEVLITLVIIGIIAAVTVPALIQQTQKQEYVTGLKKAYSTLQNALYKIADNHGYPHDDYSFLNNTDFIDELPKVANVVKQCNSTADCFPSSLKTNSVYKYLNGTTTSSNDGKTVIMNDGQMYTGVKFTPANYTNGLNEENKQKCIYRIIADLNGWKKPNKYGYDVYMFYIIDGTGFVPAGLNDTSNCNKSDNGTSCAAKVLKENKISY